MDGYRVLWVPGTDHAGIATQNVVERRLAAEGLTRAQVGRKEFIKRVWEWKQEAGNTILHQLKALGVSCDWEHERFTMDEGLSLCRARSFRSPLGRRSALPRPAPYQLVPALQDGAGRH